MLSSREYEYFKRKNTTTYAGMENPLFQYPKGAFLYLLLNRKIKLYSSLEEQKEKEKEIVSIIVEKVKKAIKKEHKAFTQSISNTIDDYEPLHANGTKIPEKLWVRIKNESAIKTSLQKTIDYYIEEEVALKIRPKIEIIDMQGTNCFELHEKIDTEEKLIQSKLFESISDFKSFFPKVEHYLGELYELNQALKESEGAIKKYDRAYKEWEKKLRGLKTERKDKLEKASKGNKKIKGLQKIKKLEEAYKVSFNDWRRENKENKVFHENKKYQLEGKIENLINMMNVFYVNETF